MTDNIEIINQIKMIRKIIQFGYESALLYADIGDEKEFTKTLENKTRNELFEISRTLKGKIYKSKPKSVEGKFCIGKCNREFIQKDEVLEIYCPSCDRTIATRSIKSGIVIDFKEI